MPRPGIRARSGRKYLITVSDGITYLFGEEPTAAAWSWNGDQELNWAGPDNWNSKYGSEEAPTEGWSSWPPDEDIFIRYFNDHKDWRIVIAPHVIGEDHLQQILSKLNRTAVRYTQTTPEEAAKADCLIIDCFGLLSSIYSCAKVTYVGGGFGVGIHNVLEAAVWNVPVIFGPNNKRFQEAQELLATQGGMEINSYEDFERIMDRFDSAGRIVFLSLCARRAPLYSAPMISTWPLIYSHSSTTTMVAMEPYSSV